MKKQKFLRLFFLRHGQTEHFSNQPFNGWIDAPLTELGKKQLNQAALALQGLNITKVYSSDLSRAIYGGQKIAENYNLTLKQDERFREIHFGDWEGFTYTQIKQADEKLFRKIFTPGGYDTKMPNGESPRDFYERVAEGLNDLINNCANESVALVAHSGVCRAIITALLKLTADAIWSFQQDFACLNIADIFPKNQVNIRLINGYLGPDGYNPLGIGWERFLI